MSIIVLPVDPPFQITTVFGWVPNYPLHPDGVAGCPPKPAGNCGYHIGLDFVSTNRRLYLIEDTKITCVPMNGDDGNAVYYSVNGRDVAYCHLDNFAVPSGIYKAGTYLGQMGATGSANGVHCHIAMRKNGIYIDPALIIPLGGKGGGTQDMADIIDTEDKAKLVFWAVLRTPPEGVTKEAVASIIGQPYEPVLNALVQYPKFLDQNDKLVDYQRLLNVTPLTPSATTARQLAAERMLDAFEDAINLK